MTRLRRASFISWPKALLSVLALSLAALNVVSCGIPDDRIPQDLGYPDVLDSSNLDAGAQGSPASQTTNDKNVLRFKTITASLSDATVTGYRLFYKLYPSGSTSTDGAKYRSDIDELSDLKDRYDGVSNDTTRPVYFGEQGLPSGFTEVTYQLSKSAGSTAASMLITTPSTTPTEIDIIFPTNSDITTTGLWAEPFWVDLALSSCPAAAPPATPCTASALTESRRSFWEVNFPSLWQKNVLGRSVGFGSGVSNSSFNYVGRGTLLTVPDGGKVTGIYPLTKSFVQDSAASSDSDSSLVSGRNSYDIVFAIYSEGVTTTLTPIYSIPVLLGTIFSVANPGPRG